jgi:hypothetical protein
MHRTARRLGWLALLLPLLLGGAEASARSCPRRLYDQPCDLLARHGGELAVDRGVVLEVVVRATGVRAYLVDLDGKRLDLDDVRGRMSITVRAPDGSFRSRDARLVPDLDAQGRPRAPLVVRTNFGAIAPGSTVEVKASIHGIDGQRSRHFALTLGGKREKGCGCDR